MKLVLVTCLLCFSSSIFTEELSPLIEIFQGKLRGFLKNDWKGGIFYSFLSVPYAEKPVGKLRFMPPEEPKKWDGIFDAVEDMPECLQRNWHNEIIGKEDCLYLNVHTPEIVTKNLKPVMVFIHGGGYVEGTGRSDALGAEFLVSDGVVVVTIQYRLGLLGFLNFDNPDVGASGNVGLKDQNMALRWVQKNIEKFGGNPESVTIFGESAGGASVHMHMLSPMSQGLFHKVIAQSGTALNPWNTNGQRNTGVFAAKFLGFEGDSETDMLPFLQDTTIENIMKVQENVSLVMPVHQTTMVGPVIEGDNVKNAFLPSPFHNLISAKKYADVPFMLGFTNAEPLIGDVVSLIKLGKTQVIAPEATIPLSLNIKDENTKLEVLKKIMSFYYKESEEELNQADIYDHTGDVWFYWPIYKTAMEHAKLGQKDLYFYIFSADTMLNFIKRLHPTTAKYPGASHLDDLGYLFKNKYTPDIKPNSLEAMALGKVVRLWTNFAKYGNPTPKNNDFNLIWKPVEEGNLNFLNIGTKSLRTHVNPFAGRMSFWDNLHDEYSNKKNIHTEL